MVCGGGVTQPDSAPCPDAGAASLDEVRQIYRRLCLLRLGGARGPDHQLAEQELAQMLARLPTDAVSDHGLREIYAAEDERIADAYVLARLLVPLLAGQMALPTSTPIASGRGRPLAEIVPLVRQLNRPASSPSVADFIDEMIAAEQAGQPGR